MNTTVIEINPIDMLYRIMCKWRRMIVWMIAFALIMTGVSAAKTAKEVKELRADKRTTIQKQIQEVKKSLTIRDMQEAEQCATTYAELFDRHKIELTYYDNSILMQSNSQQMPTYVLQYEVTVPVNDGTLDSVLSVYKEQLLDDATCAQIADVFDEAYAYPEELVDVVESDSTKQVLIQTEGEAKGILNIEILADNKEHCEAIEQIVETRVVAMEGTTRENLEDIKVEKISGSYRETVNTTVNDAQAKVYNNLLVLRNSMNNIKNGLVGSQREYFNYLCELNELENKSAAADAAEEEPVKYFSIKYFILGVILGLVLAFCYYMVCYIISLKLRTKKELCQKNQIELLGNIIRDPSEKRSGIDLLIDNIFNRKKAGNSIELQLERIAQELKFQMQDDQKILITGSLASEQMNELTTQLKTICTKAGIQAATAESVVDCADTLGRLQDVRGIVIVEKILESDRRNIVRELELFERYQVPVIGAVVIDA